MKKTAESILLILSLVCIGLLPNVQAVSPPPDGGYPGGNTAEGQDALLSLTTGTFTQPLVFSRSRATKRGRSTQPLALGRSLSTPQTKIRQSARERF
jgi:hypothetical protein